MLQSGWARLNGASPFQNLIKWRWMMKKCLHPVMFKINFSIFIPAHVYFSLNHNINKWLMGFLWPCTCPPNKSNQLLVESQWMFVPNVRKFPGGVSKLLCSREWNRHMDDRTRWKRYASSTDNRWHNKRQHPACVHYGKISDFPIFTFSDFYICWHYHPLIDWILH